MALNSTGCLTSLRSLPSSDPASLSASKYDLWLFCAPCFRAVDNYMMHTYQASVRAKVNGRSQVIKTEIHAMNVQDARWLLWAQYGFHSIQAGPHLSKAT
jgi:hypothetical protein